MATVTIMADKDLIEKDALKAEFPETAILICLFHVLRTFRREITTDKLGITMAERRSSKKWHMPSQQMNTQTYTETF